MIEFEYFLGTKIMSDLNINKMIKSYDYELFNEFYYENYFDQFKTWFIPEMNKFLNKNFKNRFKKIDVLFLKIIL